MNHKLLYLSLMIILLSGFVSADLRGVDFGTAPPPSAGGSGNASGAGTPNHIAKWITNSTIGDSAMYQDLAGINTGGVNFYLNTSVIYQGNDKNFQMFWDDAGQYGHQYGTVFVNRNGTIFVNDTFVEGLLGVNDLNIKNASELGSTGDIQVLQFGRDSNTWFDGTPLTLTWSDCDTNACELQFISKGTNFYNIHAGAVTAGSFIGDGQSITNVLHDINNLNIAFTNKSNRFNQSQWINGTLTITNATSVKPSYKTEIISRTDSDGNPSFDATYFTFTDPNGDNPDWYLGSSGHNIGALDLKYVNTAQNIPVRWLQKSATDSFYCKGTTCSVIGNDGTGAATLVFAVPGDRLTSYQDFGNGNLNAVDWQSFFNDSSPQQAAAFIFESKSAGSQITIGNLTAFQTAGVNEMTLSANGNLQPYGNLTLQNHLHSVGTATTISDCGITPSISGNDISGNLTVGTGVISSCTVKFANAYAKAPHCFSDDRSATVASQVSSVYPQNFTISFLAAFGGGQTDYYCIQ